MGFSLKPKKLFGGKFGKFLGQALVIGGAIAATVASGGGLLGLAAFYQGAVVAGGVISAVNARQQAKQAQRRAQRAQFSQSIKGTVEGATTHHYILVGRARVGGVIVAKGVSTNGGGTNDVLRLGVVHSVCHPGGCGGLRGIYVDDTYSDVDAQGFATNTLFLSGAKKMVQATAYTGNGTQSADSVLVTAAIDPANAYRRGLFWTHFGFLKTNDEQFAKAFSRGIPGPGVLGDGWLVYDPRKDSTNGGAGTHRIAQPTTWEWSTNVALWCGTYHMVSALDGGYGGDSSEVDWSVIAASANVCDETISSPAGTIKRYECNGVLTTEDTRENNRQSLLQAMAGTCVEVGGKYKYYAGAYRSPTVTIDSTWMRGEVAYTPRNELQAAVNAMRVTFDDASDKLYNSKESPQILNATYQAQDGGDRLYGDLSLDLVTNTYQAQYLGQIALARSRLGGSGSVALNLCGLDIEPHEFFNISHPELPELAGKVFRVTSWKWEPTGPVIEFAEEQASTYTPQTFTVPNSAGATTPAQQVPDAPTNLSAMGVADGCNLTWDKSQQPKLIGSVLIERSLSSTAGFTELKGPAPYANTFQDAFTGGQTYYYRVRYKSKFDVYSAFSNVASSTGKTVQNGATVGAPSGTFVGSQTADAVAAAVGNYNTGNDRIATAIVDPTVASDGSELIFALNTDGTANIRFTWGWSGAEGDIDGFLVYLRNSQSSAVYSFGTSPNDELVYVVPAYKRAVLLSGLPADNYQTWGVQAYRKVDKDVNASGTIRSTLIKPSQTGYNPYRPVGTVVYSGAIQTTAGQIAAANVNQWGSISGANKAADNATVGAPLGTFVGSVPAANVNIWTAISGPNKPEDNATVGAPAGTFVNGVAASTISAAAQNFNGRNDRNSAALVNPVVLTDGTAVDHVVNANASVDISFEWQWSGNEADIDGFYIYVYATNASGTYTFGSAAAAETVYPVPAEKRAFILFGVTPNYFYTFGVRAYRVVDKDLAPTTGMIVSSLVKPGLSSENPYQPITSVAFNGNVTGTINGINAGNVNVWSSISGAGKPDNNATSGAPAGTFVNGIPAANVNVWSAIGGSGKPDDNADNTHLTVQATLRNPRFAAGDRDWTKQAGWSIVYDASNSRHASASSPNVATFTGSTAAIFNDAYIPVTGGDRLTVSCYGKSSSGATGVMYARLTFFDASLNVITDYPGPGLNPTTTYQQLRLVNCLVPNGSAYGRMNVAVFNRTAGTWYLDDCSLVHLPRDLDEVAPGSVNAAIQRYALGAVSYARWMFLGTWTAASQGDTLRLLIDAGTGYNTGQNNQATCEIVARIANDGAAPNLSGATYRVHGPVFVLGVKVVATSYTTATNNKIWGVFVFFGTFAPGNYSVTVPPGNTFSGGAYEVSDPGSAGSAVVVAAGGQMSDYRGWAGAAFRTTNYRNLHQNQVGGTPLAYTSPPTAPLLTSTSSTIDVKAHTVQIGSDAINYNTASPAITGLSNGTLYHVYCDDPEYAGGSPAWSATTSFATANAGNGRYHVGSITVSSGGTGGQGGGGAPYCVAEDALLGIDLLARDIRAGGSLLTMTDDGRFERAPCEGFSGLQVQEGVRVTLLKGASLDMSLSTPLQLRNGLTVTAASLALGQQLAAHYDGVDGWDEVRAIDYLGRIEVAVIHANDRSFAAGRKANAMIYTHNKLRNNPN